MNLIVKLQFTKNLYIIILFSDFNPKPRKCTLIPKQSYSSFSKSRSVVHYSRLPIFRFDYWFIIT